MECANKVILCPGDESGSISSFFIHEIRNNNTRALIPFDMPTGPSPVADCEQLTVLTHSPIPAPRTGKSLLAS